MVAVRITRRWLVETIEDEEKGAREYERRGFNKLAAQERLHKQYLLKLLRRMDEKPEKEDVIASLLRGVGV